jgi:hypothetical protein
MTSIDKTVACSTGNVVQKAHIGGSHGSRTMKFVLVATGGSGITVSKAVSVTQGTVSTALKTDYALKASGSSYATTDTFNIPASAGGWAVDWSYNCPAGESAFNYEVDSGNSVDFNDEGSLDLNSSGNGTDFFDDSGVFDLQMLTPCAWTIDAWYVPATSSKVAPSVTATLTASAKSIPQAGGPLTVTAAVKHATWCTFISSPPIAGIDGRVRCKTGSVTRQALLPQVASAQSYEIEVVAVGSGNLAEGSVSVAERDPQTLVNMTGVGHEDYSAQFVIPASDAQWTISWSYSCPLAYGFQTTGDLGVIVSDPDPVVYSPPDIGTPAAASASGTETYTGTGPFTLDIYGSCNWALSVVG